VVSALVEHDHRFSLLGDEALSLSRWVTPDPDLADVPFVALDLETTGSRPGGGKITEIGAVRIEGLKQVAQFNTLVNPMRPIPPFITHITGITPEMVADAPRIEEIVPELLEFLKGAVIVAHNASFDVTFLNYELRRLKGRILGEGAFDTLPLSRALAPGLPNYRLGTVAQALGAPAGQWHRALADAQACGHVFLTLVGRMQERGITSLGEARAFMGPNSRSCVDKLRLTRDIPRTPGAYRFLDKDGRILYIGKAEHLRDRVRSYFVTNAHPARKVRQAIRQVEQIEWTETCTPLEAVVKEQELILEHRPPCNVHGGRPENYAYLKVSRSKMGLHLFTTSQAPKSLTFDKTFHQCLDPDTSANESLIIGPFRGRSRLAAAMELLQKLYRLRRCPRRSEGRPCVRGHTGHCLAPCSGDPEAIASHDSAILGIVSWIAGLDALDVEDPKELVRGLLDSLSAQCRFEEAQWTSSALEDLLSVRRSYASLSQARGLRVAALWVNGSDAGPSVRVNLVWNGKLVEQATVLCSGTEPGFRHLLEKMVAAQNGRRERTDLPELIAVPQEELDGILAVNRWFKETPSPAVVMLDEDEGASESLEEWCRLLIEEAARIVEENARP
jgi:DNA polymerase-3 subunit epsilon